eukprot:2024673-Pleurochrysis_carterae.AAC.1
MRLLEPPGFQPWEERALPATAGLGHPVDRFDYTAHACASVGPGYFVPWRWMAVHNFVRF